MIIYEYEFKQATGVEPINDDLERVNCSLAGYPGHLSCGWCLVHVGPVFSCGCTIKP